MITVSETINQNHVTNHCKCDKTHSGDCHPDLSRPFILLIASQHLNTREETRDHQTQTQIMIDVSMKYKNKKS